MSAVYPIRRRNPFGPYDPNDPQDAAAEDSLYAPGPDLGPAGGPPQAPAPSLYQPAPTGPMPDFAQAPDAMRTAQASLYGPNNAPQMPPPGVASKDVAQSAPLAPDQGAPAERQRMTNLVGDQIPTLPDPPRLIPYPKYDAFAPGHSNAMARAAVDAENKHNELVYAGRLRAYEAMTSARALGATAPAESQLVWTAFNNPDPAIRAQAQAELDKARKFNAPQPKEPAPMTLEQAATDALLHPEKYPNGQAQKIISDYHESRKYAQPDQRGFPKSLAFAPDGTPIVFDPNAGRGSVLPGYQTPAAAPPPGATPPPGAPPSGPAAPAQPPANAPGALPPGPYTKGGAGSQVSDNEIKLLADAIEQGKRPPVTTGLARSGAAARLGAELQRRGFDLARAETDWKATQRHMATLNGTQQTRLNQAINTASESLGVIEDLARQWDGGGFPILNRAQLALARNGVLGPKAQQLATNLTAQITDVTSELGQIYMGGNSPTDHALGLAQKNLSADWTKDQLLSAIKLARTNLAIRRNSIQTAGAVGVSPNSPYLPPAQGAPAPSPDTGQKQKFSHVSESGKFGWDGSKWVPIQ